MNKATKLLHEAQSMAPNAESWADLSNALFDPRIGIVAKAFPDKTERESFVKTAAYKKIRKLVADARERFGLIEGATPKASGKLVVRMPQTLHQTLRQEALEEGISLNQLIVYKLAAQMPREQVSHSRR